MASIIRDKNREGEFNGCRTIQFIDAEKRRKSIRLGKVTAKTADTIKVRVEAILQAKFAQLPLEPETASWIGKLEPALYDKLAGAGLLPKRERLGSALLGAFLDGYIASRIDVKGGTRTVYDQTRKYLLGYFSPQTPLASITVADASGFRRWLSAPKPEGKGLAENTVRKRCSVARQFFREAVEARQLSENPFGKMKGIAVGDNRARDYFLTREDASKVLAACPDNEWRLIFALSRYGGLRCPSEHLALTWTDIDWEQERITVRSPKTEHVAGHESRVIPLFSELREYLEAAFDAAPERSTYVIAEHRHPDLNLRTNLLRIIERAGLKPWPKLFQNLRATRATELASEFPGHVAAEWLGHSTKVASKHYWRVTDADFEKALEMCMQKCKQKPAERGGTDKHSKLATPVFPAVFCSLPSSAFALVGDEGLEPPTSTL